MDYKIPKEKALCELCSENQEYANFSQGSDFEYHTTDEEFEFVRCKNCGIVFLLNRPTKEAMNIIYPSNYYSFQETKKQNYFVKKIRDHLEKKRLTKYLDLLAQGDKTVFDIGCGDGRLLDIIKKNFPKTWTLSGIEIGENAVKIAKDKGYNVLYGDFEFTDMKSFDNTSDLIFMHQVLEHTRAPRSVIKKMNAMLKKGGLISIETPDTDSWDLKLFKKRYWGGYHFPRHFYLFNKKNIVKLLAQEGFEVISCKSLISPVFWIHSLHNYFTESKKYSFMAKYFHYQSFPLLCISCIIDSIQLIFFSKSSNMQIIAKKIN